MVVWRLLERNNELLYMNHDRELSFRANGLARKFAGVAAAALIAGGVVAMPLVASAQNAEPAVTAEAAAPTVLSYTDEQADRGEDAYVANCSGCHGRTLGGEAEAPGLVGAGFRTRWFADSPAGLFAYISNTMPQQAPGSLEMQTYVDIFAYLVQRSGYPTGETELAPDADFTAMTMPVRPE